MTQARNELTHFAFAVPVGEQPRAPAGRPSATQLPGVLAGRYRLDRLLGAGGMGVVYQAWDLLHEQFGEPDPSVALKVMGEMFAESPDADALLYSEFALMRRLRHPQVVQVHTFEVDRQCQRAFFTMELMSGVTLDKLLCECPKGLPWREVQSIVVELFDALAHAHGQGVLHGDLKPANLMLGDKGVQMFDFGLGQATDGVLQGLPQLSRNRFKAWTPAYAAPELLEGGALSCRADVYSAACVLYELLAGVHPFNRQSPHSVQASTLSAPTGLPARCWPALQMALAFDVERRSISAVELRGVLQPGWFKWFTG